ncbi:unnamed protein product [Penicillium roqueforti FM164]|uniref:Genomic scaffold, ProqFM164S03 n=1 Tax=Penicillium roqueforti (strain FM164) TaxID=1365484 RepID=W6QEC9_PENRF|nr:unnamed protein product [Penicillium roqueforti FM164]
MADDFLGSSEIYIADPRDWHVKGSLICLIWSFVASLIEYFATQMYLSRLLSDLDRR